MRIAILLAAIVLFGWAFSFTACKSSAPTFCDTTCISEPLSFSIQHPDSPYITINMENCLPDTVTWSHNRLPEKRKILFSGLAGKEVRLNKDFLNVYIKDTSYVWMTFNDCVSGQGFLVKIPFNKSGSILRKNSAFNPFDKRFSIAENLTAYTDKGNIFVEDMVTGKKSMMTFGRKVDDIDYTNIHESIDSVVVTPDYIRVRIKIDNEWRVIDRTVSLQ